MTNFDRVVGLMGASVVAIACASPAMAQTRTYSIPAQSAAGGVAALARQSDQQVLISARDAKGKKTREVRGEMTIEQAFAKLLAGSGLTAKRTGAGAWAVVQGGNLAGVAAAETEGAENLNVSEILVTGRRSLNTDVRRTEDDVQPYVVFGREELSRSQATSIEDFLKTRLPMNTVQTSNGQIGFNAFGSQSSINLRGLGTNQTLILVDGRRLPGGNFNGTDQTQPDINGIPIEAIERIEVLPSTASGIYGGGATGGVVNIILRRDYTGLSLGARYGISSRGDAQEYRVDIAGGATLGDDATRIAFSGHVAHTSPLVTGNRDFAERARALQLRNNPTAFNTGFSPPLGATPNIRSANGSNLTLDNGTALGSPFTSVPIGYSGPASDGGAALVGRAGTFNLDIPNSVSGNTQSLLSETESQSASLNVRREFGPDLEVYVDGSWYRSVGRTVAGSVTETVTLQADAPTNPFTTPIIVRFPAVGLVGPTRTSSETYRVAAGLVWQIGAGWSANVDYSWSRNRSGTAFTNPITGDPDGAGPGLAITTALSNGTLNVLRDVDAFRLDYQPYILRSPNQFLGPGNTTLESIGVRVGGPVFRLPGGNSTVTMLAEQREERAGGRFLDISAINFLSYFPPRSQQIRSAYAEVVAPIVSARNNIPLISDLELRGSVRYDRYETSSPDRTSVNLANRTVPLPIFTYASTVVDAASVTVGLKYSPSPDIALRASFGTGFLPPTVAQLVPATNPSTGNVTFIDPKRGNVSSTFGPVQTFGGGSPDLLPEESESLSLGIVITPRFASGLRFSLDYTRIEKANEIATLDSQTLILLEDVLPGRITRAALTPADAAQGFTGGVITRIDAYAINVARTQVEALDFQADYTLETRNAGRFHLYAVGTRFLSFERQTTPNIVATETVGFSNGQLKWRGNIGLDWDYRGIGASLNAQYYGPYRVYVAGSPQAVVDTAVLNQGNAFISSQLYVDALLRYRFEDLSLAGASADTLEISVGVQNLFDTRPPVIATTGSTGGYSTFGDPRLRRFTLGARLAF